MPRKRVLYFTVVPLMDEANGGNMACRNHVRRLAADPGIDVFVAAAGQPEWEAGTRAFAASLGLWVQFDYFVGSRLTPKGTDLLSIMAFAAVMVLQTPWDLQAFNQTQIDQNLTHAIAVLNIDILVIDYTVSALYVQLPRTDVKTCLIKLNSEEDFYRELITHTKTHHGRLTKAASVWRWGRIERRIDRSVDQVIAIGSPDLPRHPTRRLPVCITPTLDLKDRRWTFSGSNTVFFVGGIAHYPNKLAVEWIATRIAPKVAAMRPEITFAIVGSSAQDVPKSWRAGNITYLGPADRSQVERLFLTADLFLCPVENNFGVKFKAAEALSFGIPILASSQTLLGLPYLPADPHIALDDPAGACTLICALAGRGGDLEALSAHQQASQQAFVATQNGIWSRTLAAL